MSDSYRLFALQPIYVHGKGEVAPKGHLSDATRALMRQAHPEVQGETTDTAYGLSDAPDTAPADPWGDLR